MLTNFNELGRTRRIIRERGQSKLDGWFKSEGDPSTDPSKSTNTTKSTVNALVRWGRTWSKSLKSLDSEQFTELERKTLEEETSRVLSLIFDWQDGLHTSNIAKELGMSYKKVLELLHILEQNNWIFQPEAHWWKSTIIIEYDDVLRGGQGATEEAGGM